MIQSPFHTAVWLLRCRKVAWVIFKRIDPSNPSYFGSLTYMVLLIGPLCKYPPFISIDASLNRNIGTSHKSTRIKSNCTAVEYFLTVFFSLSLFPFGHSPTLIMLTLFSSFVNLYTACNGKMFAFAFISLSSTSY